MTRILFASLLAQSLLWQPMAAAQTEAPYVLQTTDGTLYHCSQVERQVEGQVTVTLPDGQVLTFSSARVRFVGPAASFAERGEAPGPLATLAVGTHERGLELHRVISTTVPSGMEGWSEHDPEIEVERLCALPCSVEVPLGSLELALSSEGRAPIRAGSFDITHDLRLEAAYDDASGVRSAGLWTLVLGAVAGAGMAFGSFAFTTEGEALSPGFMGMFAGGAGVILVSTLIALVLAPTTDEAMLVRF